MILLGKEAAEASLSSSSSSESIQSTLYESSLKNHLEFDDNFNYDGSGKNQELRSGGHKVIFDIVQQIIRSKESENKARTNRPYQQYA